METPLLVFRVGYMAKYDGFGKISDGGAYVEEHGEGGEMWNFQPEDGYCYGYVMTKGSSGVDLSQIEPDTDWSVNDELSGVITVFMARRGSAGQVVIGWYEGATVFHKTYLKRPGPSKSGTWKKLDYLCQVPAENAVLLPEAERTFEVPYAPVAGKGFPGQSNLWYATDNRANTKRFVTRLRKYIASNGGHSKFIAGGGNGRSPKGAAQD
jgi:hypothetical protein